MSGSDLKENIQKLVDKLDSIDEKYDDKNTSSDFIRPFFQELGWDLKTDVISDKSKNSSTSAFQIDKVTRFFLKEFPLNSSLESYKEDILSLLSHAYNKGVTWAIVSNFKETRVYNTESTGKTLASMQHYSFSASEYIEKFEYLSDLTKKQFSLNVLDSNAEYFGKKPKRVPIDKQLLNDLLEYREMLVNNIIKENTITGENAGHATQKILNRLIFIRSCGDRQIENRYLKSSLRDWEGNKEKKLIQHLQEIFAYFRGRYGSTLFENHVCDELIISDDVLEKIIGGLYQSRQKAIQYNFATIEHDTLGKMYENYYHTVQRKKDGAYYTPAYISRYICENAIIPYLSKSGVTNIHDLISEYADSIEELEVKIRDIKILDPACGTGEFLIRAIDVLLEISKEIQIQKENQGHYTHTVKKKKSGSATFQTFDKDVENQELRTIIRNNIHGVDINEEAIEITQLNLFLKLATSSQQLMDVSNNIRVGNSLIEDNKIDQKAFEWKKEFSKKFDVIIGNPPYVNIQLIDVKEKKYLFENYKTASGRFDFYVLFYEKCFQLLNKDGFLSFITSNKFFKTKSGANLRKEIIENVTIKRIIDFGEINNGKVFEGLTTYPVIITIKKILSDTQDKFEYIKVKSLTNINLHDIKKNNCFEHIEIFYKTLTSEKWKFLNEQLSVIYEKIQSSSTTKLKDISKMMYAGLITGDNETFFLSDKEIKKYKIEKELIQPLPKAINVRRYHIDWKNDNYVIYPYKTNSQNSMCVINLEDYPNTKNYLVMFKNKLESRKSLQNTNKKWYELMRPRKFSWFQNKKIITPNLSKINNFSLDFDEQRKNNFFVDHDAYGIILKNDDDENYYYILGVLNSKLVDFFIKQTSPMFSGGYYKYHNQYYENTPIVQNNQILIDKCIKLVKDVIQNKKSGKVTKNEECELDQIIYQLYGITDDEKKIIESSI